MAEVITALDFPDAESALALVDRLGEEGSFYKVGLELFTRAGPAVVEELVRREKRVFLDLKFHDIPNTVTGAVRSAASLGVDLLTVHSAGGGEMMQAAREAVAGATAGGGATRVVAVTILTSLGVPQLEAVWGREIGALREDVLRLATLAQESGLDGVVASALETEAIRRRLGPDPLIVTPGIRPAGTDTHDQNRVATPADAVRFGSSHLVLGRAVTRAEDPLGALRAIKAEVAGALPGTD
jgi:orotidine-5'-phosphate decarboxylase